MGEIFQFIIAVIAVCVVIAIGYFIIRVVAHIVAFIIYGVAIIIAIAVAIAFIGELFGFVNVAPLMPLLSLLL